MQLQPGSSSLQLADGRSSSLPPCAFSKDFRVSVVFACQVPLERQTGPCLALQSQSLQQSSILVTSVRLILPYRSSLI